MNIALIGTLAEIRMGVTLRGRDATRPDPQGSCRMIRISDISDDGVLQSDDLLQFEPGEKIRQELFLRPGDILFPNRGTRTTACVFDLRETNVIVGAQFFDLRETNVIVGAQFFIIRVNPNVPVGGGRSTHEI